MNIGFLVVTQDKEVNFQLFQLSISDRPVLVTYSRAFDCSAVFMGRLYYRHELLPKLASRLPKDFLSECESNYAALALAAYWQFGFKGLEQLEGDFALVIWDAKENRLIGIRDPMGGYPLFWTESNGRIALSNSLSSLLDLLPHRKLSLDYLAEFLMIPGPVNERSGEGCAYEGIHRVLAGTIVSINISTKRSERHGYWNWLERIVEPTTDCLEEISQQYADLLRQAVRERICGRTTSHLSGGMDSTAVSSIARDLIASGAGEAPLHSLSLVYSQLPGLAREMPYLESVLQQEKDIVAHRIPADDLLDFDSFTNPPPHDEPYAVLWRLGMDRAIVNAAANFGSDTMLTGLGADEMLDVQPFYITDLLRQRRFRAAWTEACKWARADNCSPWGILYPFGIASLFPAWTRGLSEILLRRSHPNLSKQNDWSIPPWILPGFARRQALRSYAIGNALRIYRFCNSTALSFAISSIESRIGDVIRWSVAAPQGIAIAHPFLDVRILRFCLGIQAKLKPEPGRMKPILAEAMQGILPDQIRNRPRKGQFNEVYYLGLARNLESLETTIRQAPIDDLGILDKDILIRYLREAALGGAHVRQLHRLNLTLSLIRWLCMQKKTKNLILFVSLVIS
jgi:asparagine synthase (glutamine-hydrolysing)